MVDVLDAAAVLLAVLALLRYLAGKQTSDVMPTNKAKQFCAEALSFHAHARIHSVWLCMPTQIAFSMLCRRQAAHFRRQIVTMKDGVLL